MQSICPFLARAFLARRPICYSITFGGRAMRSLFILATTATMTVASAAFAADAIDQVPAAPVAVETVPTFTWSGPYVGIHTGYGWGDGDASAAGGGTSDSFDG